MKLFNFKELLIKKSGDPSLENLIKFMRDDVLADIVIESLEKMARAKHKGDAANLALRDFGLEMDPELEPKMIRDALGHHASRYKAALKSGRQDLANAHARQIFKIMDMADQAQKHSHGKLDVSAVSPHAWERHAKTKTFEEGDAPVLRGNKKVGQFVTDTKGWRYRGNDYGFLQNAPHESYAGEVARHGHNQAYPMNHIKVNGKYIHIEDIPPEELHGFEEHPLDKHPILSHFSVPAGKHSQLDYQKYMQAKEGFHGSPHMDKFFDKHEALEQADPEGYSRRGEKPSESVHKEVAPLDVEAMRAAKKQAPAAKQPAAKDTKSMMDRVSGADIPDHIKQSLLDKLGKM